MRQISPSSSAIANLPTSTDYAQRYILAIGLATGCTIPSAQHHHHHHRLGHHRLGLASAIANLPTSTDYAQRCIFGGDDSPEKSAMEEFTGSPVATGCGCRQNIGLLPSIAADGSSEFPLRPHGLSRIASACGRNYRRLPFRLPWPCASS
ncbi:MAG: hypothetical protein DCF15_07190 [Phormidesmis priestleyi]|uniref:Uncharacterized protein n=1 Tax=Phormidesmis priestleyi TaxID=268141 RepID=A0A2W4XSN1_9CYAN|nr:MAG: hypothetical protein DCF15_07190 [Phormidesmis priestleyi]